MRKSLLLMLLFLVTVMSVSAIDGDGSIGNPYNISTIPDLELFAGINNFSACGYWQLVNDLDLTNWSMTEGITDPFSLPVVNTTGCSIISFDGMGYKMYNLNDILFGFIQVHTVPTIFNRVWLEFDIYTNLTAGVGSFSSILSGNITNYVVFNNSYFNGKITNSNITASSVAGVIGVATLVIFDNITTYTTLNARFTNGFGVTLSNVKIMNSHINNNLTSLSQTCGGVASTFSVGGFLNNTITNTVINTTQYNFGTFGGITGQALTATLNNVTVYLKSYNSSTTANGGSGIAGSTFTGIVNNLVVYSDFNLNLPNINAKSYGGAFLTFNGNATNVTVYTSGLVIMNHTCSFGGFASSHSGNGTLSNIKVFLNNTFYCREVQNSNKGGFLGGIGSSSNSLIVNNVIVSGNLSFYSLPLSTVPISVGGIGRISTTLTTGSVFINNTYFVGELRGNFTGGIISNGTANINASIIIANSYAVPILNYVTAPNFNALTGVGNRSYISSYYDRDVALFDDGLYNRSTIEMKNQTTYDGWDFNNTWQMCPEVNNGYPSLISIDELCSPPIPCVENWTSSYNRVCNGIVPNRTLIYTDQNNCGTYNNLPGNNGTVSACCVESWTPSYTPTTCPSNSLWTIIFNDINTCGTTGALPGNNGTSTNCVYIPPVYDNQTFNGKTTTDLNTVENISAVENLTVASSTSAVQWTTTIDASNITIAEVVATTSSFISVNVVAAPELDTPADVSLSVPITVFGACADFVLYYTSGYYTTQQDIIANGVIVATGANVGGDCLDPTICTNVGCVGGVLTFRAEHFDGFGVGDVEASTIESCQNTRQTIYAGFAIIAILIVAGAAALLIMLLKNGNLDGTLLIAATIGFIAVGVVLMVGYFIISKIPGIICG